MGKKIGGRTCRVCGRLMWTGKGVLPQGQATCRPCRAELQAEKPKFDKTPRACKTCGSLFVPRLQKHVYCSKRCNDVSVNRQARRKPDRVCPQCGITFTRTTHYQVCCSVGCAQIRRYGKSTAGSCPIPWAECRACGASFVARGRRSYCTPICQRQANIAKTMGLYRAAVSTGRVKVAMHWHRELVAYLVKRDGRRCGICSKPINLDLTSGPRGNDAGPTIDHVVPRSHGGSDELSNLRIAHWSCNRARSNRGGNEQLRLVG